MHRIAENGIITMTAGDTLLAPLFLNAGTKLEPKRYVLTPGDRVFFAVMLPGQPFEKALVRKEYTSEDLTSLGDVLIRLDAEDTENIRPGTYWYEVKLMATRNDKDYVDTVVPRRKFFII